MGRSDDERRNKLAANFLGLADVETVLARLVSGKDGPAL